jgi:hypothetical protein
MLLFEEKKQDHRLELIRSEKLQEENDSLKEKNQYLIDKIKKIEVHQGTLLLEIISKLRNVMSPSHEHIEDEFKKAKLK